MVQTSGAQPLPYHVPLSSGKEYDVPLSHFTFLQLHIKQFVN
jgi:hypothetical protein